VIGHVLALLLVGASTPVGSQPCAAVPRSASPSGDDRLAEPADSSGPGQVEVPRNDEAEVPRTDKDKPFKPSSGEPLEFRGPGREEPEPEVDEVVLGWFGPGDPDHPEFGDLWRGATLALEEENAAGGYRGRLAHAGPSTHAGRPFRLLPAWSESPWKAGIADLARVVYDQKAWAVIGGVDGTTTHLAVQIALKAHFLLLSPGSTDVSADHANVPWLFSLPASDERIAPVIVEGLEKAAAGGAFVIAAATDHDSHAALVAARLEMARRRLSPEALLEFGSDEPDVASLAARLADGRARALLVLAPSGTAGRLVAAVRAAGFRGAILGGATCGRTAFLRAAGPAAEGVLAPAPAEAGPAWAAFARAHEARWGDSPDDAAACAYDAVRLAVAAVRRAGLNRALVRDAVRALAPWPGASGVVSWNALGRNERAVALGSWAGGRLRILREP
jgi:branched-chain amino acid transport system substrate-binding protein